MNYGELLNPYRSLKQPRAIKGTRQKIIVTHNPSEISQNQLLLVRFPNLGPDDVIVPGTTNLSFNIILESTDKDRHLVSNIGRAIIKKLALKFEGQEILSIDDYDVFKCYQDQWNTWSVLRNSVRQGVIHANSNTENCMKLRINAADKNDSLKNTDSAIAATYGNKFIIPLDAEILNAAAPYYQNGLSSKLSYELTFNDFGRVIKSSNADATYTISDISLEYEIVNQPDLARAIGIEYNNAIILYDRVLRHRKIQLNKNQTVWNWSFNTPCKSLKGILAIFEKEVPFGRDTNKTENPNISKVSVIVEGKPNQLFAQGMRSFEQYDEICKYFSQGSEKDYHASEVQSLLNQSDVNVGEYLTTKYALWLDFRTINENSLHGSGRKIDNASEGITLQIEKKAETSGVLNAYIYLIMDAQINIQEGAFVNAVY